MSSKRKKLHPRVYDDYSNIEYNRGNYSTKQYNTYNNSTVQYNTPQCYLGN